MNNKVSLVYSYWAHTCPEGSPLSSPFKATKQCPKGPYENTLKLAFFASFFSDLGNIVIFGFDME